MTYRCISDSDNIHFGMSILSSQQLQLKTLSGNILIVRPLIVSSLNAVKLILHQGLGTSGRAVIAFVDVTIVAAMMFTLLKNGYPKFNRYCRTWSIVTHMAVL